MNRVTRFRLIARRAFSDVQKREQEKEALINVERIKRFKKNSPYPKHTALVKNIECDMPANIKELQAINGIPKKHNDRTVLIGPRPMKTIQQGRKFAEQYQITWKVEDNTRWTNPLMGWTSGSDPMQQVVLYFNSQEDAVGFAQRNGWEYELEAPNSLSTVPYDRNEYQDNFLDKRTALFLARDGMKTKIWNNPKYGDSHWFMPLKYHGDGEVIQHGPPQETKK